MPWNFSLNPNWKRGLRSVCERWRERRLLQLSVRTRPILTIMSKTT